MAELSQLIGSNITKCSITTTKMLGIRWTVENISKMRLNYKVTGPEFYIKPECMYQISFKINGSFLYVYLCNKSDTDTTIQRSIVLFDYNNRKLHEENDAKIFSLERGKNVDMIGNVTRKFFDILPNDTLTIDLSVSIKEVVKNLDPLIYDPDPDKKLKEDLKTMLENPINSDVSVQVGDERIPAHWSILCSRSPYFKKMFDSGMKERVQNSFTFTDLSLSTVKKLLQFLYSADFIQEDDIQELLDLYSAADKYEVMDLKTLCGRKLLSYVTTDNVSEILQLSYRHNDKTLKKGTIDFVRSHSDVVFQTEGWKKFEVSEPESAELISFCLKKN